MAKEGGSTESTVFRWMHSILAYALAAYIIYAFAIKDAQKFQPFAAWIILIPFVFSSVMCRVVSAKDLKEMMSNAGNILDRQKPRQGKLE